jgi:S-DNA-T family DNA segregation ATPase FtsK/SpoIIIE
MKLLSPTQHRRLNEAAGFLLLSFGLATLLSLVSYHAQDPSWDTASEARPLNLIGYAGSYLADLCLQSLGAAAFVLPLLTFVLAWRWIRSAPLEAGLAKIIGAILLTASLCTGLAFAPVRIMGGTVRIGGTFGFALATSLVSALNVAGALVAVATVLVVSVYLVSSFTLDRLGAWLAIPMAWLARRRQAWRAWRERMRAKALERAQKRAKIWHEKAEARRKQKTLKQKAAAAREAASVAAAAPAPPPFDAAAHAEFESLFEDVPPWEASEPEPASSAAAEEPAAEEPAPETIPICPVEDLPPVPPPMPAPAAWTTPAEPHATDRSRTFYQLPPTALLNEVPGRSAYDEQELKDTAARIRSKFDEFNVFGNVVQINPGPVVTTFEFKPEAGIKYSRITSLNEDLCLGLQAESILIERIPGKPTVGIEVPNTRRELIGLRQMIESEEFANSHSHLTIPLGKDINGRIRVASLEAMPHLLIAGSTGSGKSVMINSMIMSIPSASSWACTRTFPTS